MKRLLCLLVMAAFMGCGQKDYFMDASVPESEGSGILHPKAAQAQDTADIQVQSRKIIKEGNVEFETDDLNRTQQRIVSLVRVVDGSTGKGQKIRLMASGNQHQVEQVGVFTPKREKRERISAGEVGFLVAGIKDVHGAPVGDTITLAKDGATQALPGFETLQPRGGSGLWPTEAEDFPDLREALNRLQLNDAALQFEPETSEKTFTID